jgi:uncharacterized protein
MKINNTNFSMFGHSIMEQENPVPDTESLLKIVSMKMPFGKYKGTVLSNLPVSYLEWFARKGFPPGYGL